MDTAYIIAAFAVYFLAGIIKGAFGIGFPTAAIALMTLVVDARSAVAILIIPMVLINLWQVYRSGNVVGVLRKNHVLLLCMVLAIAVFSLMAVNVPLRSLTLLIGLITTVFAISSLIRSPPTLPDRFDKPAQVLTGLLSGMIGGIAGIWAPPIIIYLTSRRLETLEFVQTVGLLLLVGSSVLLAGYWKVGIVHEGIALFSTLLVLPAIAGFAIGEQLRTKFDAIRFQNLMLVFFMLMGLNLIRRSFTL